MQIGDIEVAAGAALAPMAGVTNAVMRRVCIRYGAAYTVSEMVSAKAIIMGDKKSRRLYMGGGKGAPYGVQLFGQEPAEIAQAAEMLQEDPFDFLDLNMGCPAPKIVGHGAGSALLRTPKLAGQIAEAAVKASDKPVTAKLRIGWDDKSLTGLEVAQRCEAAGVKLLVVHARTRAQMYAPGVDYDAVAKIKAAVSIPVVVNGDIVDAQSARDALEATRCDGVMIGRGAMGRPWVFAEVRAAMLGQPPPEEPPIRQRMAVLEEQVRGLCDEYGEDNGMRVARGVAAHYVKGLRGAAALRRQAVCMNRFEDLAGLIWQAEENASHIC